MSLTRERFEELAEAYGGDVARWPEATWSAAAALMAAEPRFTTGVLQAAGRLDAALDAWTLPAASAGLRERILAAAPGRRPARLRLILQLGLGAGLAGACAAGVAAGVLLSAGVAAPPGLEAATAALASFEAPGEAATGDV